MAIVYCHKNSLNDCFLGGWTQAGTECIAFGRQAVRTSGSMSNVGVENI